MVLRASAILRVGALALCLGWATSSAAAPYAAFFIDGQEFAIPLTTEVIDGIEVSYVEDFVFSNAEAEIVINSLVLDPDPSILYDFNVTDFGAPSNFASTFTQPIIPTAAPGLATHTLSGSNPSATLPVTMTPVPPPVLVPVDGDLATEIAVYTLSTNGGITLLNVGLDLGPAFVAAPPGAVYGAFAEGPVGGPAAVGLYNWMQVNLNFALDGNNHRFAGSGEATIVAAPAPEPSSLWTLGSGLALLGLRLRSRPR
jgi:hypothetical protein